MKLNLGCGSHILEGFVNIDSNIWLQALDHCRDVNEYLTELEAGTVDEIYAGHFLEHLGDEYLDVCLKHCVRVLKDYGVMRVTVPNAHYEINALESGLSNAEHSKLVIFGSLESPNDTDKHYQVFTPRTMTRLLLEYFPHVTRTLKCDYWVADVPWQMTFTCRKK